MAELQLPKLVVRVRFPSLAPDTCDSHKKSFLQGYPLLTGDFSAQ